jgi:hypothetical protein
MSKHFMTCSMTAQTVADLAEVLRLAGKVEASVVARHEAISLHEEKGNVAAAAEALRRLLAEPPMNA